MNGLKQEQIQTAKCPMLRKSKRNNKFVKCNSYIPGLLFDGLTEFFSKKISSIGFDQ